MRHLKDTKTFKSLKWSIIFGLCSLAIDPAFNMLERRFPGNEADLRDLKLFAAGLVDLLSVGYGCKAVAGRAAVGDVISSALLPGPNIPTIASMRKHFGDIGTEEIGERTSSELEKAKQQLREAIKPIQSIGDLVVPDPTPKALKHPPPPNNNVEQKDKQGDRDNNNDTGDKYLI